MNKFFIENCEKMFVLFLFQFIFVMGKESKKYKRRRDSFNDDERDSRTHKKHNSSKVILKIIFIMFLGNNGGSWCLEFILIFQSDNFFRIQFGSSASFI